MSNRHRRCRQCRFGVAGTDSLPAGSTESAQSLPKYSDSVWPAGGPDSPSLPLSLPSSLPLSISSLGAGQTGSAQSLYSWPLPPGIWISPSRMLRTEGGGMLQLAEKRRRDCVLQLAEKRRRVCVLQLAEKQLQRTCSGSRGMQQQLPTSGVFALAEMRRRRAARRCSGC
jgi:hypothetical protein